MEGLSEVNTMEDVISDGGHLIPQKPTHTLSHRFRLPPAVRLPQHASSFGVNCAEVLTINRSQSKGGI